MSIYTRNFGGKSITNNHYNSNNQICHNVLVENTTVQQMQDLQTLVDAARRWQSWKVTKCYLVVASTRHHRARLLKYYPRPPCMPNFTKLRMLRPLQTHFLLFQQIFFVLVCIHPGTPRVPPRVLASGPKPCGDNYDQISNALYLTTHNVL